jgi:hypothetical protein
MEPGTVVATFFAQWTLGL